MNTVMTWEQMCIDPHLRDLPFKIEQDRHGRVVMSPIKPSHGGYQVEIAHLLRTLLAGWVVIVECAVDTPEGTKVPDVAAMAETRFPKWKEVSSLPVAPEICVEVLSWSNTVAEIDEKRLLYAGQGCREFWTCSEQGEMTFFDAVSGQCLATSGICPGFPSRIPD